jgi:hypothetical protein
MHPEVRSEVRVTPPGVILPGQAWASSCISSQVSNHTGNTVSAAAIGKANGSGKIAPKDTGGVELTKAFGSSKLSPKDTGGVELTCVDPATIGRTGSRCSARA